MASFFHRPTVKEQAKTTKREITRNQRGLTREYKNLEREEKKLIADIKKAAKHGRDGQVRIMAKELVRLRQTRDKLLNARAQLNAVKTRTTTMASTVTMSTAIKGATKAMGAANKAIDPVKMQKTMQNFQKQLQTMDMTEEMMDDTLADAFDDDEMEGEVDDITNQALEEIGVDITAMMASAPSNQVASSSAEVDLTGLQEAPRTKLAI